MSWPLIAAALWVTVPLFLLIGIVAITEHAHRRRLRRQREHFEDHADGYARLGSHYGRLRVFHEDGKR